MSLVQDFFEKVYKNALLHAMKQKLEVEVERPDEVMFRGKVMGLILFRFGCRKT